jgi:hypothetical protein
VLIALVCRIVVRRIVPVEPSDERPHASIGGAPVQQEEWVFSAWTADARLGIVSGHRLLGPRAWYWAALARAGAPLLHVTEWDVTVRADPFVVKAHALWAEHTCDAPLEQWSLGNETYAAALDDAGDALGRAYGTPLPIAFDLEWYAVERPVGFAGDGAPGYEQRGVVHGAIDVAGAPRIELVEVPAHRWHRWTGTGALGVAPLPEVVAHTGVRTAFAFPDGTVDDLVLTPAGWRRRAGPASAPR